MRVTTRAFGILIWSIVMNIINLLLLFMVVVVVVKYLSPKESLSSPATVVVILKLLAIGQQSYPCFSKAQSAYAQPCVPESFSMTYTCERPGAHKQDGGCSGSL